MPQTTIRFADSPTKDDVDDFLKKVPELQRGLMEIPVDSKLDALTSVGHVLEDPSHPRVRRINDSLTNNRLRGKLIEEEIEAYPLVFDGNFYGEHLDSPASIGNRYLLDRHVKISKRGDHMRRVPHEGVLLAGAGNSSVPLLVDLNLALLSNAAPVVRPSRQNIHAILEVAEAFGDASLLDSTKRHVLETMVNAILIANFDPDSKVYEQILTGSPLTRIKFTGGESAYRNIRRLAAQNPYNPDVMVAGPLTGVVLIDERYGDSETADRLAREVVVGGQKLCSSPTTGYWVGNVNSLELFVRNQLIPRLSEYSQEAMNMAEGVSGQIQRLRLMLLRQGAKVIVPDGNSPYATVVISNDGSPIDDTFANNRSLPLHLSSRPPYLLDLTAVDSIEDAIERTQGLPNRPTYKGTWKAGTIGYALPRDELGILCEKLPAYRLKPIGQMYPRSPHEPLGGDDESLVRFLTRESYLQLYE